MDKKVAIVTGASGGIGAAIVHALARQRANVAALDRDTDGLRRLAEKAVVDGLSVEAFSCDVSDSGQVESVVAEVERRIGPVDFLVNAAGVLRLGKVSDYSDEDWLATFAVNTHGVFHLSRAVSRRMVGRGRGAIVTVASNAATTPRVGMAAYGASKAAATSFTRSLGLEVARHGVRCNIVAPGSTDTPMLRSMWHDESGPKGTVEGSLENFRLGIPLGRIASPSNVADAVLYLLSDQAAHVTLHTLTVDGGASLDA